MMLSAEAAPETPPSRRLVPAIERASAVMDLLSGSSHPLSLSAIARALGLAKSSAHGICETLTALGLLRSEATGYAIGPHALRWSAAYLGRTSLVQEFEALLASDEALRSATTTLSVLSGRDVVYLACHNSDRPLGFTFRAGERLPAPFTATGKAMLSALSAPERHACLAGDWPAPLTPNSVPDAAGFEAQAGRWTALGYAVDDGEVREGMVCLGAAVRDAQGRPVAGLATSFTSAEAAGDKREALGRAVAALADRLSAHRRTPA